jgi:hypothetical protein
MNSGRCMSYDLYMTVVDSVAAGPYNGQSIWDLGSSSSSAIEKAVIEENWLTLESLFSSSSVVLLVLLLLFLLLVDWGLNSEPTP